MQIDAHLDFVDVRHGVREGHGNPMRRAAEQAHVTGLTQLGIRNVSSTAREGYEDARRARLGHPLGAPVPQARHGGRAGARSRRASRYYVTIDIDGFDPSIAPGTGTPSHGGFLYWEVMEILQGLARRGDVVGIDLVEVAPAYDPSGITAILAAQVLLNFLGYIFHERETRRGEAARRPAICRPLTAANGFRQGGMSMMHYRKGLTGSRCSPRSRCSALGAARDGRAGRGRRGRTRSPACIRSGSASGRSISPTSSATSRRKGIEVEEILDDDMPNAMAAMERGDIDCYLRTVGEYQGLGRRKETQGIIIGTIDLSTGGDGWAADQSIKSVCDLKGKTIAVEPNLPARLILQMALKKECDLSIKDTNLADIAAADAIGVFADPNVAAVGTYEPVLSQVVADAQGARRAHPRLVEGLRRT